MNLKHAFNRVFGNLLPVSERIRRIYGRGKVISIVDMLWCVLVYGAHPKDYFMFEFYKKNGWERNSYLTIMRYLQLVKKFDKDVFKQLGDKIHQHEKYRDLLLRFVMELARVEPRARFVGWDIAILPDRFELIEMNFPGGHDFLQAFGKGYYRVIKSNW